MLSLTTPLDAVLVTDLADRTDRLILADYLEHEHGVDASGLRRSSSRRRRIGCRWMIVRDLPEVLASEQARADGWSEADLRERLKASNCIGMAAESRGDVVVGHVVYELHVERVEVVRLCVHPDWRGHGVMRTLAAKVASKLSLYCRSAAFMDVPAADLDTVCALLRCSWQVESVADGVVRLKIAAVTPSLPSTAC